MLRLCGPLAAFIVFAVAQPAAAQVGHPAVDLFGGYSHLPADGQDFPRQASHGVQVTAGVNLNHWFGVIGDFGAHFSTARDPPARTTSRAACNCR
jgi:hypothetical protein